MITEKSTIVQIFIAKRFNIHKDKEDGWKKNKRFFSIYMSSRTRRSLLRENVDILIENVIGDVNQVSLPVTNNHFTLCLFYLYFNVFMRTNR